MSEGSAAETQIQRHRLTIKLRLKDKHAACLNKQAAAVNVVWNFCNETQQKAAINRRPWLNYYDLARLTSGSAKLLNLHCHTVQRVCRQYDKSRFLKKKPWLRWRGNRSLGWVPFNTGHVRLAGSDLVFNGQRYETMHFRSILVGAKIGAGSFNSDSRGRWYINLPIEINALPAIGGEAVGIDLGLHEIALSDGEKIALPRLYRKSEAAIAQAQRAKKKKRHRAIHKKVANRRKDFTHKVSHKIASKYKVVCVGDVSSSKLRQTHLAKSVSDAGWTDFREKLSYKTHLRGGVFLEVPERMSSQTCSSCGEVPEGRPRGIAGLSIRRWTCCSCGSDHDRDVNAARNIARAGLRTLAEGAQ